MIEYNGQKYQWGIQMVSKELHWISQYLFDVVALMIKYRQIILLNMCIPLSKKLCVEIQGLERTVSSR